MAAMGPSRTEVEVKLGFPSPEEALRRVEALPAALAEPRRFEDNRVYDLPTGDLRSTGRLLRLRLRGARATLTFKSRVPGDSRHKVQLEHETAVSDMEETDLILRALGFSPWYRYQKYRTVYRFDGVEISVDETPIGCFVELEGDPEAIDRVAALLGFGPERYIRGTYRELHEAESASRGTAAGDLVFADPAR
jgi:adenylate cyclase class 2